MVLSLAPRGFYTGTTVFPLLKEQYFQTPIRPGMADEAEPPCGSATLFSFFKRNFHVPTPLRFHRLNAGASDAGLWILKMDTALLPGWIQICLKQKLYFLPP